jgi:hypothetical protein
MFDRLNRIHLAAAAALVGLGAAGFATADGTPEPGPAPEAAYAEPLHCEIVASPAKGMLALEGVLHSDTPISGSYRFRVVSQGGGGSSNIQQGGEFFAGPDAPVSLGTVMIGNRGGSYKATLEVVADGKTIACTERTGGAI